MKNNDKAISSEPLNVPRCESCLWCMAGVMPDPNAEHIPGKKKPTVPCFRCHATKATAGNGFPVVEASDTCPYHTNRHTGEQSIMERFFTRHDLKFSLMQLVAGIMEGAERMAKDRS